MRYVHFTWFLLCSFVSPAQSWCPAGATWWYDYSTFTGGTGYVQASYVADTVVAGMDAKKIAAHVEGYDQYLQQPISYDLQPIITAYNGDAVTIWTGTTYDTLFWFGATPGDQWAAGGIQQTGTIYTVTDTGSVTVDGLDLRWWAVDLGDNWNVTSDTIYERIGGLHVFLRPAVILAVTDPEIWDLRCYHDESISVSTGVSPECDFILGMNYLTADQPFHVYPDPCSSLVYFPRLLPRTAFVEVSDASGRLVSREPFPCCGPFNVSRLRPGAYCLRLMDVKGAVVASARFIKD